MTGEQDRRFEIWLLGGLRVRVVRGEINHLLRSGACRGTVEDPGVRARSHAAPRTRAGPSCGRSCPLWRGRTSSTAVAWTAPPARARPTRWACVQQPGAAVESVAAEQHICICMRSSVNAPKRCTSVSARSVRCGVIRSSSPTGTAPSTRPYPACRAAAQRYVGRPLSEWIGPLLPVAAMLASPVQPYTCRHDSFYFDQRPVG